MTTPPPTPIPCFICGAPAAPPIPDPRSGSLPACASCRFEALVRVRAVRLTVTGEGERLVEAERAGKRQGRRAG